jgi:hypothetical protein
MEILSIKESTQTPSIVFNLSEGILTIIGKSYPENVNEAYAELFKSIAKYHTNPQAKTIINFQWLYYNTASAKIIVKILYTFLAMSTQLEVNWHCEKDFCMMIEKGELIKDILEIPLNIVHTDLLPNKL